MTATDDTIYEMGLGVLVAGYPKHEDTSIHDSK